MRRRGMAVALAVAVALAGARAATGHTGVSGTVESSMELSLDQPSAGRVAATATATVAPTQLSVSERGHEPRVVRGFRRPVFQQRVTVRGTVEQTITFGPQGP